MTFYAVKQFRKGTVVILREGIAVIMLDTQIRWIAIKQALWTVITPDTFLIVKVLNTNAPETLRDSVQVFDRVPEARDRILPVMLGVAKPPRFWSPAKVERFR